jgi:hypothetical protein
MRGILLLRQHIVRYRGSQPKYGNPDTNTRGCSNATKEGMDTFKSVVSKRIYSLATFVARSGVGNSFGFAGHIRDKLGICGPKHAHVH